MKKMLLVMVTGMGFIGNATAEDLMQVYQQALQNDPAILQSKQIGMWPTAESHKTKEAAASDRSEHQCFCNQW